MAWIQISDGRQPQGLRLLQYPKRAGFFLWWRNKKKHLDFVIKMCQAERIYITLVNTSYLDFESLCLYYAHMCVHVCVLFY